MKKVGIMISEISFSNMPVLMKNAGLDFLFSIWNTVVSIMPMSRELL